MEAVIAWPPKTGGLTLRWADIPQSFFQCGASPATDPAMHNRLFVWLEQRVAAYRRHRWLRMRCPHGMPGGLTRQLCAECAAEAQERALAEAARRTDQQRREREQAEHLRHTEMRRRQEEQERLRRLQAEQRKAELRRAAERLKHQEIARAQAVRLRQLDSLLGLSPRDFERNVAKLYERLGFQVQLTPAVGDLGVDIIAVKGSERYAIECKRFGRGQTVGTPLLQKLHSAMHVEAATKGVFVTTSRFSAKAKKFGAQWNVALVDGKRLCELFASAFPVTGSLDHFHVMCAECGQVMRFPLMDKLLRARCPNGHIVICDSRGAAESLKQQDTVKSPKAKKSNPKSARQRKRYRR